MTHTVLVTRDAETGTWHCITNPSNRTLEAVARIEGTVLLAEVDPVRRTAKLVRAVRGDGAATLTAWARRNGLRPIAPDPVAPFDPLMVAGNPRPHA